MKRTNSIVPLILGIIGGVFAILGGTLSTFCAEVANAAGESKFLVWGYLALGAGILGLVGGCIARKTGVGLLLMIIAAIIEIICVIFLGFIWTLVVGAALFVIGGIVGFVLHS